MILDTSAVVAILFGEPEAAAYMQMIHAADRLLMSAGNFLELSFVIESQAGAEAGRQSDLFFRRAGIVVVSFSPRQARVAQQAFRDFGKGRHPAGLNFGDCFAYALAKVTGDPLLFKGDDFSKTDITPAVSATR
jgi:ribonuclease VapC